MWFASGPKMEPFGARTVSSRIFGARPERIGCTAPAETCLRPTRGEPQVSGAVQDRRLDFRSGWVDSLYRSRGACSLRTNKTNGTWI